MKRLSLLGFASVLATLLAGCPIYDDNDSDGWSCAAGGCGGATETPSGCTSSGDCGLNQTCGKDNVCHTGDCTHWGCSEGFECTIASDHTASCSPSGGVDVVYCGNPDDCAASETCAPDGTCQPGRCSEDVAGNGPLGCIYGYTCVDDGTNSACTPENPAACGADVDCAGLGERYLCVSGICTAPADQCFDQTQCRVNDKCVEGKCTPSCSADVDCPGSYLCDTARGICTKPAQTCAITNDCGGPAAVCVDGACVPRSNGPSCPEGTVWVENGCIPNQSSNFVCKDDGVQDECAPGSICLHHSCYIACGQPNPNACANQPESLNECRTVTTSSGVHAVCGSSENLGDECAPERACGPGNICIDGFCK